MIKLLIIYSFILTFFISSSETEWDAIYTKASYALNHTKKALGANNFDHQRFYSEKALESYLDIEKFLERSNDEELKLKIEHTINDLEHAVDAPDWDRGRYYSKRVHKNTQELITVLDLKSMEAVKN